MRDPYEVLGVEKTASEAAIRAAYRKLAKKHHPDVNPGDKSAETNFKEISAAYELLSDKEKRRRFDAGEIDASGAERPPRGFYRDFGDQAGRTKYHYEGGGFTPDDADLESIFGDLFRGAHAGGGMGGREFHARGGDAHYSMTVDFVDAANGASRRLTLPDGRTLDVTIPPGLRDGQVLRLKGQGMPGFGNGPAGDALIEVTVAPHPQFRRDGDDVILELPVTLKEAVLGAKIEVPTLKGPVTLTIPPNSGTGTRLRLRDRGIGGRGHQFVELSVVVPAKDEPELAEFLKGWTPRHADNPRKDKEQAS